jgi:hypothetical protein
MWYIISSRIITPMAEALPLIQDPAAVLAGRDRAGKGKEVQYAKY